MMRDGTYENMGSPQKTSVLRNPVQRDSSYSRQLLHIERVERLPSMRPEGSLVYHNDQYYYRGSRSWIPVSYDIAYKAMANRSYKTSFEMQRTQGRIAQQKEEADRRAMLAKINEKFKADAQKRKAALLLKSLSSKEDEAKLLQKSSLFSRDEIRQEYNLPAIVGTPLKERLDFWNYPDWQKAGNIREGGQPFWMFDNAEQPLDPAPEPPKPTHRAVKKRIGSTSITVMEKIVD